MKTLAQTNVLTLTDFQGSLHLVHPDVKKKLLDLLRFGPIEECFDKNHAGYLFRCTNSVTMPKGRKVQIDILSGIYSHTGESFKLGADGEYIHAPVLHTYAAVFATLRGWKRVQVVLDFYRSSYLVGNIPMMKNHFELDHPLPTLFY